MFTECLTDYTASLANSVSFSVLPIRSFMSPGSGGNASSFLPGFFLIALLAFKRGRLSS
jgi:hypothetical protein